MFVFSLPHGTVGDSVVDKLHPFLEKGDIIIDASNEHWENTQRRQGKLVTMGVFYVGQFVTIQIIPSIIVFTFSSGMGVSGGYQAARRGPSMCPGGEEVALDLVLPLLEKVAAKDHRGQPCVVSQVFSPLNYSFRHIISSRPRHVSAALFLEISFHSLASTKLRNADSDIW